jgi:DNA-directed RNA polymerase specialized sigma24 family protein
MRTAEPQDEDLLLAVRDTVLALPAQYRETVVLCDLHEMPYEQAA